MKIKRFNQFRINETSEITLQRWTSDVGQMGVAPPDAQLSINAFDIQDNAIRDATAKINGLLKSLSNTPQFMVLKSRLSLQEQNITSMKILRIEKSNNINYNFYIKFIISEEEYWGVVENILDENPVFKSEVFKDSDLILSKEWVVKTKGLVVKIIKKWLNPEPGKYKLINPSCYGTNIYNGKIFTINNGDVVEMLRSYENKIMIKYNNEVYNLTGDNFIYFNYWFVKI